MPDYKVRWEYYTPADSPEGAAREARKVQLDPSSLATHFVVYTDWSVFEVDLKDAPQVEPTPVGVIEDIERLARKLCERGDTLALDKLAQALEFAKRAAEDMTWVIATRERTGYADQANDRATAMLDAARRAAEDIIE